MSEHNTFHKPFSNTELSAFCGQIALILQSGISALEGLHLLLEDSTSAEEKALLEAMIDDMHEHGSFRHALESTGVFPSYLISMTALGEETGTLDNVMSALRMHYERENHIRRSIQNAVTYPLIMIGMMLLVIFVLLTKVLPVFQQVFLQLGTELTGISRVLLNIGTGISRYSLVLCVLLFLLVLLGFYGLQTSSGRVWLRRLTTPIPPVRRIYERISACRFASGMALTLKSGLNPERSMELVRALIEDPVFLRKLDHCNEQFLNGADVSSALFSAGIFTGMYARMVSIASKTGTMDQAMEQIASLYQEEIDLRINNTLAILEPTLVIFLSLIAGTILLSVMLPLLGIMSGI